MKEASELTMRVFEGGRAPSKRTKKRSKKSEDLAEAMVAPIGLKADVTPKLLRGAPAFGDVLRSLAHAAAVTQTALDDAALQSLQTLAAQPVEVPVLLEQELDDNGVPTNVTIRTESVPLTSIIAPSMQRVENLMVRMDMQVQSFDATSGIKFNQNMGSMGVTYKRHGLGLSASLNNTNVNAQFASLSDFSSGSVLMSMDIADRTGFQIPTPLEYGVGANLMIRLLGVTQTVSTSGTQPPVTTVTRTAELSVKQVRKDGTVVALNLGDYDVSVPPGLQFVQAATLKVSRNAASADEAYAERKIHIIVGQLIKEATFYL